MPLRDGSAAALHLVTLLGCLLGPGYVYLRSPHKPANRAMGALGLAGALFNGFSMAAALSTSPARRLAFINLAFIGAFLLLPIVTRFPRAFLGDARRPPRPRLEAASWLVALGFSTLAVGARFIDHLGPDGHARGGLALAAWSLVVGAAFLDFCHTLYRGLGTARDHDEHNRVRYLLLGAGLFAAAGLSDLIHRLGMDLPLPFPLAPAGSLAFLACLCVAVVKHRLLDIEVVIHRGLVLSLLAPSLALAFVVSGELLEGLFRGTLPPDSPYPDILAALLAATLFGPLSGVLSRVVEVFVIAEFRGAPELRAFRQIPFLIGAGRSGALRDLARQLEHIANRLEGEAPRNEEASPRWARRAPRGTRRLRRRRRRPGRRRRRGRGP